MMNKSWPLNAWLAKKAGAVHDTGQTISSPNYNPVNWIEAVVPGTVLTTLLKNGVPGHFAPGLDPYFGQNSHSIPDISEPGNADLYTYWFRTTFAVTPPADDGRVWLYLRGINYSAQVYVNGVQVKGLDNIFLDDPQSSGTELRGMFLRNAFDITALVRQQNALAVLVNPPNPPGTPSPKDNGGNPNDPNIGENVTMRYTVGWDWVMSIPDRNTGIWDEVMICTTGPVLVLNPHVVTTVLDANGKLQPDAKVTISAEVYNASEVRQTGALKYNFAGLIRSSPPVTLLPKQKQTVTFSVLTVTNPRLWWPNGYGSQELYTLDLAFETSKGVSDTKSVRVGIRQISTTNNQNRVFFVNGQRIFIKGGNWIGTDAMLRLSNKRYRDEVRLHAEMNLNFIRVWGGGIAERPEFYDACDEYGILVMQDFWISGEFQGPFPEGYTQIFLNCAKDTIRMLRNHPSLCLWSGGNEAEPPSDINKALRCYVEGGSGCAGYELLDGTRIYIPLSFAIGGGGEGDGPYGIQDPRDFFALQSCPINPEVGSVGTPAVESIKRMMLPDDYNRFPQTADNATWTLHKYIPYSNRDQGQLVPCTSSQPRPVYDQIAAYGNLSSIDQFCFRAQLTNYMQYKALFEGFLASMWKWYAGVFVWKSQNPWTGLRGQLYDWYLDQTGGFYGAKSACEMVHIQLNLQTSQICVINHSAKPLSNLTALVQLFNHAGLEIYNQMSGVQVAASSVYTGNVVKWPANLPQVYFVKMYLLDATGNVLSDNFYWQSSIEPPDYKALQTIPQIALKASVRISVDGDEYVLNALFGNPASSGAIAFFIRLKLLRPSTPPGTENRILPAFYEDNYFSLLRGEQKSVTIRCAKTDAGSREPELWVEGWNITPVRVPGN